MQRASVILIGVILVMNIANALGEVSYRTVRVDDLPESAQNGPGQALNGQVGRKYQGGNKPPLDTLIR